MTHSTDTAAAVKTAVEAINTIAQAAAKADSGIDDAQIAELRLSIDRLENALNEQKRAPDAA